MSWLRIAAMRAALQILRGRRADRTDEEKAEEALVTDDPELDYLRVKYASDFRDAFAGALQGLPKKERTVLQLYLVDGLNIDKIGKLYGVHRATVGRWIAATKDQLYEQTENRLRERLRLSSTEFDSIVRLVQSQLDLSVRRLLCEGSLDAGSQR